MPFSTDNPKAITQAYVEKHKLPELMEGLLAEVIFNKPANPKQYIVMQLEKIKVAGTKPLLNQQDLSTMFSMFDVTGKGVITEQQAGNALKTILGSRAAAAGAGTAPRELDTSSLPLAQEEFVQLMTKTLCKATPLCRGLADDDSSS